MKDYDEEANEIREAEDEGRKSTATILIEMALARYEFGQSTTGEVFARPKDGPRIVSLLRGSRTAIRSTLAREFYREYGRVASQTALADALSVVEGFAQETDEQELHLRVAQNDAGLWLDLGDLDGRAVLITRTGWEVLEEPPMLFKRTTLNGALPEPEAGGDIADLWRLLNVSQDDRPLLLAAIVASLMPNMPHPVIALTGEAGTGKTTTQKIVVSMIDPGPVPVRKAPRDSESWVTAAQGSWVVGLDNLSEIQPWLSDSICRAVTGDGDVRRKLYTDGDHAVFAFRRCVCLNGIDLGATRGDLGERMLPISLQRIPEHRRLTEDEIWPLWEKMHPRILGVLLDLTAGVLSNLPSVELESKPRMADFAKILRAVDMVLGTDGLAHYISKQSSLAADSLSGDSFSAALAAMTETFEGTSAELRDKLTPATEKPPRDWPKNPRQVTTMVRRAAPSLIKLGWSVEDDGGHNQRKVLKWRLCPPKNAGIEPPPAPPPRANGSACGNTGMAGIENGASQADLICASCAGEGCACCDDTAEAYSARTKDSAEAYLRAKNGE
jgi:hypothetical protein